MAFISAVNIYSPNQTSKLPAFLHLISIIILSVINYGQWALLVIPDIKLRYI